MLPAPIDTGRQETLSAWESLVYTAFTLFMQNRDMNCGTLSVPVRPERADACDPDLTENPGGISEKDVETNTGIPAMNTETMEE